MPGVMDELFSPATRHTAEEIAGKQNGRVDLSVGDDGWIDLDGGRVRPHHQQPFRNCRMRSMTGIDVDEQPHVGPGRHVRARFIPAIPP